MKKILGFSFVLLTAFAFAADARFEQGARFEAAGKYEKALAEYRSILASEPHNAKAFYAAGTVRFKMKDYKGAIANYELAIKYDAGMKDAREGAAKAYEMLGDRKRAAELRGKSESPKSVAQNAPKSETSKYSYASEAFLKAKRAFDAKDYKGACSAARELLLKEPGHPGAYYYAGAGRYELGELDKAEYNLKRSFGYPELGYNAHFYLSLIYRKQGKAKEEKAELEEYVRFSQNEAAVANAKARLEELSGPKKFPAAETSEKSETAARDSVKESVAQSAPEKPLASEPKPAPKKTGELSIAQANDAYLQGDYAGALSAYQALQKRTRDESDRAFLLFQIGNIYRIRRDFRSAVAKYREAVELYPNSEWAREAERAWEDAVWQERNADKMPRR